MRHGVNADLFLQKINLSDNWKGDPMNNETIGRHNCIPDEHYIQTLLAVDPIYALRHCLRRTHP